MKILKVICSDLRSFWEEVKAIASGIIPALIFSGVVVLIINTIGFFALKILGKKAVFFSSDAGILGFSLLIVVLILAVFIVSIIKYIVSVIKRARTVDN